MTRIRTILATLALALVALAPAQALDFEIGHELSLDGTAVYGFARYNHPLGAGLWILPEGGLWLHYRDDWDPAEAYLRAQLLLDQPIGTLFIDARATLDGEAYVRTGVRFGLAWGD